MKIEKTNLIGNKLADIIEQTMGMGKNSMLRNPGDVILHLSREDRELLSELKPEHIQRFRNPWGKYRNMIKK